MGGEREKEKPQCTVASHAPYTGDPACNPGLCPDWELNLRSFGSQAGAQSTMPSRAHGPFIESLHFFKLIIFYCANNTLFKSLWIYTMIAY